MKKLLSMMIIVAINFASLSNAHAVSRQNVSSLIGAVGGGVLGSNIGKGKGRMAGAAIGALGGAAIGNWMGENMDSDSGQAQYNTPQYNAPQQYTPQIIYFEETQVVPVQVIRSNIVQVNTYQRTETYCREYTKQVIIGGRHQQMVGTACQNPDGSWRIVR